MPIAKLSRQFLPVNSTSRSAVVALGVSFALATLPIDAQSCSNDLCGFDECHTPAFAVPQELWGEMEPTDQANGGQLPLARDSTNHDQAGFFGCAFPYFESLDIENGWLFVVTNRGFQIWDARTPTKARQPLLRSHQCNDFAIAHPVPVFPTNNENAKFTFGDVDAPPDNTDVVVTVMRNEAGVAIWDTRQKSDPKVVYQDHGKNASQVYATTISGRHYAFAASGTSGVFHYDLTSALALTLLPCLEVTPGALNGSCGGVFQGLMGTMTGAAFVDGAADPANGEHFVAFTGSRSGSPAFEVWDVADPDNPRLGLDDSSATFFGVAMWKDATNGNYYLALRSQTDSRIYRDAAGCLLDPSSVCTLADLTQVWSAPITSGFRKYVTYSESNGVPFLYFGSNSQCASDQGREVLFEISNPSAPRKVGSDAYWGFYYRTNFTQLPGLASQDNRAGFNWMGPRTGKFNGDYFYRAAFGIFDVHEWKATRIFKDGFESGDLGAWAPPN